MSTPVVCWGIPGRTSVYRWKDLWRRNVLSLEIEWMTEAMTDDEGGLSGKDETDKIIKKW